LWEQFAARYKGNPWVYGYNSRISGAQCLSLQLLLFDNFDPSMIPSAHNFLEGYTNKAATDRGDHLQVHCPTTKIFDPITP
jgi:hypothetical protein